MKRHIESDRRIGWTFCGRYAKHDIAFTDWMQNVRHLDHENRAHVCANCASMAPKPAMPPNRLVQLTKL